MNSLTEYYKYAAKNEPAPSITGPMAGSLIGGSLSHGVRHHLAEKFPKRKFLAHGVPGGVMALTGLYLGDKLSKMRRKKQLESVKKAAKSLVPVDPPKSNIKININKGFKGAVPQAKDAGKKLIKVRDNIPRL